MSSDKLSLEVVTNRLWGQGHPIGTENCPSHIGLSLLPQRDRGKNRAMKGPRWLLFLLLLGLLACGPSTPGPEPEPGGPDDAATVRFWDGNGTRRETEGIEVKNYRGVNHEL